MTNISGARVVLAEARMLNLHIIRTPALVFWLLAAVVWPLSYVALLGNAGTTPLALDLSLCAIPVGPLLWAVFGARLTVAQGREIPPSWPAAAGLRSVGAGVVLVGWSMLGSLAVFACTLWGVEAGFWRPAGFAISSLAFSLMMLVPTVTWWTAIGFTLGHRTKGIFKTVLAVLPPAAFTVAAAVLQGMAHQVNASPLLGFVGLSTAAWFTGLVDAFGLGPWAGIFSWAAWLMVAVAAVGLALAALSAYGRQAAAAGVALLSLLAVVGIAEGLGNEVAALQPASATPGASYRAGVQSPVQVTSMRIAMSLDSPPDLAATADMQFTAENSLTGLRFFLPERLAVTGVRLDGKAVEWLRQGASGWVTVDPGHRLPDGQQGSLDVSYHGNPRLLPGFGAPNLTTFVAAQGWDLPPGTWYPLLGRANRGTQFRLQLQAPAGYLSVTPYGIIDGSTAPGTMIAGTGESMSLVGGHFASFARVGGIMIYAAADQLNSARASLDAPVPPNGVTGTHEASCLAGVLRPTVAARMVWTTFGPIVPTPDAKPWQPIPPIMGGGYFGSLGLGAGPSYLYESTIIEAFGTTAYSLWLNGGRLPDIPQTGAAAQLGEAVLTACSGDQYNNGLPVLDQVGGRIAALPRSALRQLTPKAYAAYKEGRLTETFLETLWQQVAKH